MKQEEREELIRQFQETERRLTEKFKQSSNLDSAVLFEIPQPNLDVNSYRNWLIEKVEMPWMIDFNGNKDYCPHWHWNEEGGIIGKIGGDYLGCKLYRFDGTIPEVVSGDFRAKRGLWFRDHYSEKDVAKIQLIADNFLAYLIARGLEFTRFNFDRATKVLIKAG